MTSLFTHPLSITALVRHDIRYIPHRVLNRRVIWQKVTLLQLHGSAHTLCRKGGCLALFCRVPSLLYCLVSYIDRRGTGLCPRLRSNQLFWTLSIPGF